MNYNPENYKAGFVALLGIPNAGKSTLTNCLVGEKVSIVTNKPQTTRRRISGIVSQRNFQAILVDAPGAVENTSGLNQFLRDELDDVIRGADTVLALLNLDAPSPEPLDRIIEMAQNCGKPWAAVISKTDLGHGNRSHTLKAKLENSSIPYIEISAHSEPQETRDKVFAIIKNLLPPSPAPLYSDEAPTTENVRDIVAETIREKCFEVLFQEIPYQLAVQIRAFEEGTTLTKIYADIIIEKENQRKIVVGMGAANIKMIGTRARVIIEKLIGHKVYLELHVKVKKKWFKDPIVLKELGYVIKA
ncbi:MAG: GTPase Era [Bdellovibrionota bacterium]